MTAPCVCLYKRFMDVRCLDMNCRDKHPLESRKMVEQGDDVQDSACPKCGHLWYREAARFAPKRSWFSPLGGGTVTAVA